MAGDNNDAAEEAAPDVDDDDDEKGGNVREQDRFLPIANISRIMKKALPANAKIAKDAKETASNTLILFEEVDVLRGEDRGFMAALAQLIAGAKRPIVLTSNSPSLPSLIDAPLPAGTSGDGLRLARVRFRSPSPADAAVYASLVAAAEGKRVSPGEVASAARLADAGDVRRALLSAQFAASSPAAEMTRRPTRGTTKSRSTAAVAALEYDTNAVAAVAANSRTTSRLIRIPGETMLAIAGPFSRRGRVFHLDDGQRRATIRRSSRSPRP